MGIKITAIYPLVWEGITVKLHLTFENGVLNLDDVTGSLKKVNKVPDEVIESEREDIEREIIAWIDSGNDEDGLLGGLLDGAEMVSIMY